MDVHVGKFLMNECFLKYLKGKTIILITHALYYLKYTDYIFVMDNGQIDLKGTYSELKEIPHFNELLNKIKKNYSKDESSSLIDKNLINENQDLSTNSEILQEKDSIFEGLLYYYFNNLKF